MKNYLKLIDSLNNNNNNKLYKNVSLFKSDIKKHIDNISKKYITNENTDFTVILILNEYIYTYICSEQSEFINYGHSKHVLITSQTTLIGVVFILVNATKNFNKNKYVKEIEKIIITMYDYSRRLIERIEKVQKAEDNLNKALKDTKVSSEKINNKIQILYDGYVEEKDEE